MRWENANQGRAFIDGVGVPSTTAMLTVVFYALKRQKLTDEAAFATWARQVEDFDILPDPEDPSPDEEGEDGEPSGALGGPTGPNQWES